MSSEELKPCPIVKAIIDDLTDRRGLKQEWHAIDEDVQRGIIEKWNSIVAEYTRTEALTEPKPSQLDPDMPTQELRLHMGELTANEVMVARAAIRWANTAKPSILKELADLGQEMGEYDLPKPDDVDALDALDVLEKALYQLFPHKNYATKEIKTIKAALSSRSREVDISRLKTDLDISGFGCDAQCAVNWMIEQGYTITKDKTQ